MKTSLRTLPFVLLFAGALTASRCGSSAVTSVTGPTSTRCQASLSNSASSFGPAGGTGTISVSIDRECSWSATTPVAWIQLTSATSGQGEGSVSYRVTANPDPIARNGAIVAAQNQASIAQAPAPCEYSVSGPVGALPASGGNAPINIQTNAACNWTAKPSAAWATVSPASGTGPATVAVILAGNPGDARTVTIAVGSASVDIQQQAAPAAPPPPPPPPAPTPAPTPAPDPTPTPPPPPPAPTPVDLSGRISDPNGKCPNVSFSLDAATVETSHATDYSGGGCKDLKDGTEVEVRGTESGTVVTAKSIAIKKERR